VILALIGAAVAVFIQRIAEIKVVDENDIDKY
jgi:hypothetical protein